jgi:hypothetical protein
VLNLSCPEKETSNHDQHDTIDGSQHTQNAKFEKYSDRYIIIQIQTLSPVTVILLFSSQ